MTMVRGTWSQLMAPGLHSKFVHWLALKQRDEEYTHLFNLETSTKAFEDMVEFSGLGPMPEKPEAESTTYQDAIQGGTVRAQHVAYALGVRCSWELHEDDQYGLIMQVPKAIARSAHFTKEQVAANIFNLGFTTAVVTADGVSLFNNQHPLLGGPAATTIGPGVSAVISAAGTFPNRPAVDVDLSQTSLQAAIDQFERLIDSQGIPVQLKPRLVVIPPKMKWVAREILGSAHKPYTADNEINAILNEDLHYFIYHYLTSDSAWFLLCDKDSRTQRFITRHELDDDYADDFDTYSIKTISRMRFSTTPGETWMGTWGTAGV